MKTTISLVFVLMLTALMGLAQAATDPANIYALGGSWNQSASTETSQQFAATALYARKQSEAGTYAFTAIDIVPTSVQPITLTTQTSVGVAQRVLGLGGWTIYATVAAGPSWTGMNTGWAWLAGGMASHPLGKTDWKVAPNVRTIKSSVNNNSGYQIIIGALLMH